MKLSIVSIVVAVSFLTCNAIANPLWYHTLPNTQQNYCIGYAQAPNEAEAKKLALRDIASQISVRIQSSYSKHLELKNSITNKNIVDNTTIETHATLNGYAVLKLEVEKGIYFIALGYENIASIDKFNRALKKIPFSKPELQNCYLSQTQIAKEIEKKIDFRLTRRDTQFYLNYDFIFVPLDDKDFSHFFATVDNPNLSIISSKGDRTLYDGDTFFFKVTSAKEGYVSIFSVYEDGTVSTLVRNIHVKAKLEENIPDKEFESVLQAGLIEKGKETFDMYVVVYSEGKKHYDIFARADEELISDEKYKNFDALIEMLNEVEFATLKIVTKPR